MTKEFANRLLRTIKTASEDVAYEDGDVKFNVYIIEPNEILLRYEMWVDVYVKGSAKVTVEFAGDTLDEAASKMHAFFSKIWRNIT